MISNINLINSSEFYLNNVELFLREIPTSINIGELDVDSLRLLVFYLGQKGPYELAVQSGFFTGTLEQWLLSLYGGEGAALQGPKGDKGDKGDTGLTGAAGKDGTNGTNGIDGKDGAKGDTGAKGDKGDTGPIGPQGIQGEQGPQGEQGVIGPSGLRGETGKSAYDLYVETSEGEYLDQTGWLYSLKGNTGENGQDGVDGLDGKSAYQLYVDYEAAHADVLSEEDWLFSLRGSDGITQDATTITFPDLVFTDSSNVVDTDTLLVAVGKLQAQIEALSARVAQLENPAT